MLRIRRIGHGDINPTKIQEDLACTVLPSPLFVCSELLSNPSVVVDSQGAFSFFHYGVRMSTYTEEDQEETCFPVFRVDVVSSKPYWYGDNS